MSTKRRLKNRSARGGAIIGLVLAILFFMLFVGLFAFDANRAEMCQRELIAACDSASICGTAMLTSYDTSPGNQGGMTIAQAQNNAAAYAINMFKKCVVLGAPMSNATYTPVSSLYNISSTAQHPAQVNMNVSLGDPDNGFQGVAAGDARGRTIMIFCCYAYQPVFLSAIPFGMQVTPLKASSFGGLPQVDAVVAFDYSGSMDDFTGVLFVRREWCWPAVTMKTKIQNGQISGAPARGYPMYTIITGPSPGGSATLSDQLNWNYSNSAEGSGVNVLPPQNLEQSNSLSYAAVQNQLFYDYNCSNTLRANPLFDKTFTTNVQSYLTALDPNFNQKQNGIQMSGSNDYGQPPGNWKPYFTWSDNYNLLNLATPPTPLTAPTAGSPPNLSMFSSNIYNLANPGGLWMPWIPTNYFPNHGSASGVQPTGSWYTPAALWTTTGASPVQYSAYQLVGDKVHYTDLIVNIVDPTGGGSTYLQQPINSGTGNPSFSASGVSVTFPSDEPDPRLQGKTFTFPNVAYVVEAARGNLDNTTNYNGAQLGAGVIINGANWNADPGLNWGTNGPTSPGLTPMTLTTPGQSPTSNYYQLAYERIAMLESQPYATACDGCQNGFFYKLATLADTKFSLVGFSSVANGTSASPSSSNCLPGYGGTTATVKSAGTATINSCFHSYYQWFDANSVGNVIAGNNASAMHHCWWRSNTSVNGNNGGTTANGASTDMTAWNQEQVWAYNGKGQYSSQGGNETGFKLPRLPLSTNQTGAATTSQVCMAASIPTLATGTTSPYTVAPVGDIWSASASAQDGNGVWNGRPSKATYSDEALYSSFAMFNLTGKNSAYSSSGRKAARRAIVFFTDGEPTGGITGATGTNTTTVATNNCEPNTIAIFAIGLNATGNAQLTADQYSFLGDNLNNNYTGSQKGLAYYAGNGGRFFQCATGTDVRSAFASIARRLSQAQQ